MKKILYTFLTLCLALFICAPNVEAQSKKKSQMKDFTVYGNVKSDKGIPLMGVEVNVQDSFIDAITDENGDFSITVPTIGSVLVFSTDYYKEFYQTITSDGYLQIVMEEAPEGQGAKDKVNMPYWTTQQRDLTASLSTVTGETLRKAKVNSIGNALMGRVMGMTARALGGGPGFDESQFLVRFNRTLNNRGTSNSVSKYAMTEPLIIVDGFERDFAELDPNEIESLSFLKDAAGTAIYGDRAANGVILVNTKRGQTNKRVIEFNFYEGIQNPIAMPDMVDAATHAEWYNEACRNDGVPEVYSPEDIDHYRNQDSPLTHPDVDWYETIFKKSSPQRRATISMSGGNQIARYFVLFGYSWQASLLNGQHNDAYGNLKNGFTKYNLRSNLDVNLTKWLTFSATFANRIEEAVYPNTTATYMGAITVTPANAYPVFYEGIDPELNQKKFMLGGGVITEYHQNPYGQINYAGYYDDTYRYYQMSGSFKADFSQFGLKGLYAQIDGHMDGYNYYEVSKSQVFQVWNHQLQTDGSYLDVSFNTPSSLSTSTAYNIQRYNGLEGKIGYSNKWADHKTNLMAIYTQQRTELKQNNQSDFRYQNIAFWGNYSYKNRYFADITLAYAGCDRFYFTDHRRTLFPSVGLGWIISDEPWMQGASNWLNFLKLRGSWGISGSNDYTFEDINGLDERYPARERYWTHGTGQQKFGVAETGVTTITEGRSPNPDIRIEKGAMSNVALEGSLFNHKLSFIAEGWYENRYDIYTASTGVYPKVHGALDSRMPITNNGIVHSWGTDLQLSWNQTIGDFSYGILGQYSWSDNTIVAMGEVAREYPNLVQTGDRLRVDYGLKFAGFFKDQDDIDNSPQQTFGAVKPGDMKYEDINGDGIIDSNDFTYVGMGRDPRAIFNLCLNMNYKGFGLELLFQGTGLMTSQLYMDTCRAFTSQGTAQTWMAGRWHYDENGNSNSDTATYPRFTIQGSDNNFRCSDFWEIDATYVRLKNVELSYSVPQKWIKNTALDKARIYFNAFNPYTWSHATKYCFDAEDWLAGSERYPRYRTFNIGVDLTF